MVKDHSYSERGNPLPPHRLLFPISSKGSFICIIPQTGWYIPRPLLHQSWNTGWNEKQLNGTIMKDRSDYTSHHERTLLPRSYISLLNVSKSVISRLLNMYQHTQHVDDRPRSDRPRTTIGVQGSIHP